MKKKMIGIITGLLVCSMISGCSLKKTETKGETAEKIFGKYDYDKYVKLGKYKNLSSQKVSFKITDSEIKEQIDNEINENAEYKDVTDRGAQKGDCVNVNYKGKLNGKEFDGSSEDECDIVLGEGDFLKEVEDALVGMKAGEEKTVDAKLTSDFYEENVGKTAQFNVKVNKVQQEDIPTYDEAYLKKYTKYKTKEEYENSVKKELLKAKQSDFLISEKGELLQKIVDGSKFTGYPDKIYKEAEEEYDNENEYWASVLGMEVDEYVEKMGGDEESKKSDIETTIHQKLVIGAIAQKENITLTNKEYENYIKDIYKDYDCSSVKEFKKTYPEDEVKYQALYDKVLDFVYDKSKKKTISETEYNKQKQQEEDADSDSESESDMEEAE